MYSRLAFALLSSAVLVSVSPAQQTTSDVVVQGASLNDVNGGWPTCGADGQLYRGPSGGDSTSVMRVSRDGSTLLFRLPEHAYPQAVAATNTGVNILSAVGPTPERRVHFQMFHFDSLANLLAHNRGTISLRPSSMATLASGTTILVGAHANDPDNRDEWKYGFAILDENDQLIKSVYLPLPPGGGGWTFVSPVAAGDGVAHVMLHSSRPPQTAIATISEKGDHNLDITIVAAPIDTETRHHNYWVFGPGVAVDVYIDPTERPHVSDRFDEYDLASGTKIATKRAYGGGFQFGCYMGDSFSMLAHSAHVDPASRLSPDTLRLVTTKLQ
jgi:hypothetical protein